MSNSTTIENASIVVQQPSVVEQLILLFHGVGAKPESLLSLGQHLMHAFPQSMVVSVAAPYVSDLGMGYQWFSVQGVTEENRPPRVQSVMPLFAREVSRWQSLAGVDAMQTALIGFSQGAIMALEASALEPLLASRIVAHSGRFAQLPVAISPKTSLQLIHGKSDNIISYRHSLEATQHLQMLGADFITDVIPHLGHEMNQESMDLMISHLKNHIPRHAWARAMETGVPARS
jgi:phospholipase/carboxylesterase